MDALTELKKVLEKDGKEFVSFLHKDQAIFIHYNIYKTRKLRGGKTTRYAEPHIEAIVDNYVFNVRTVNLAKKAVDKIFHLNSGIVIQKYQPLIDFIRAEFPTNYADDSAVFQDALIMLYKDTLDKCNQGEDHEGKPLTKSLLPC